MEFKFSAEIQNQSDFVSVGDQTNHIDAALLSVEPNYRWLSFGYESLAVFSCNLNSDFVTPFDLVFFLLGSGYNSRIFLVQLGLDFLESCS